jgi:hypothetical protein
VALIRPGESVDFAVHAFDAKGRPLGVQKAEWTVEGLSGRVDANGRFAADKGRLFEAGTVKATAGGLSAEAGVRVMPDLPWSWDFEDFEDGQSPPYWIGASRKYVVREIEGNKVLVKAPRQRGLNRTSLYMGPSSLSNYTIEADVLGIKQGRRVPDIGLIAGGYILDLQGAHQKVQIRSWTSELRMARDIDYPWETGRWYRMKLRVDADEERATIRGKVWPRDEQEPEAWTLTVEDPLPIAGGSPGLVGYSPTDLYYLGGDPGSGQRDGDRGRGAGRGDVRQHPFPQHGLGRDGSAREVERRDRTERQVVGAARIPDLRRTHRSRRQGLRRDEQREALQPQAGRRPRQHHRLPRVGR